jgi:hypothetical protein
LNSKDEFIESLTEITNGIILNRGYSKAKSMSYFVSTTLKINCIAVTIKLKTPTTMNTAGVGSLGSNDLRIYDERKMIPTSMIACAVGIIRNAITLLALSPES